MTTAPESKPVHHARRRTAHVPRPLPGWLQVGVLLLLLAQGLQTIFHRNEPSQPAPSTDPLARFAYTYPAGTSDAGTLQPAFQYASYYAHAPGAMNVTPFRAYAGQRKRGQARGPFTASQQTGGPGDRYGTGIFYSPATD